MVITSNSKRRKYNNKGTILNHICMSCVYKNEYLKTNLLLLKIYICNRKDNQTIMLGLISFSVVADNKYLAMLVAIFYP